MLGCGERFFFFPHLMMLGCGERCCQVVVDVVGVWGEVFVKVTVVLF